MRSISNETIEQVLDAGADLVQAVRDFVEDNIDELFVQELDAWETAYHTLEAELAARQEVQP